MDPNMENLLRRMGWNTGMHIPLANKENQALQEQIEALMIQKAKATQLYEAEETRFNNITNHLKFVKQQNTGNQDLLRTYRQHLDAQEHKYLLTQAEKNRVDQEIRQSEKSVQDINARINTKKGNLARGMQEIDKLKSESKWDAEALEAWEDTLKKRDEINELLQKFSHEDAKKAKDLEIKRQNLQVELVARENNLAKSIADLSNYHQILERTGKVFKQLKEEQASLLTRWKEAIVSLKRRDEAVDFAVQEMSMMQDVVAEKQEKLDEQNEFLKNEMANNKEIELKIEEMNNEASRVRLGLNELVQYVLTLNSEAGVLKRNVIGASNYLEKERGHGRNLTKEINGKQNRIIQLENELSNTKQKFEEITQKCMSVAEKTNHLEKMLEKEQLSTSILNTDIDKMQGMLYRTRQGLYELTNIAKTTEVDISGAEVSMNQIKKRTKDVNHNLQLQNELNYNLDFTINLMERKLDKLEGTTVREEDLALEEKILDLEQETANKNEIKHLLQAQVNQVELEMRRIATSIQAENEQLSILKNKLQSEVLIFENGTKQTAAMKQISQQKQVDENILRLQMNQLETVIKREDDNIFTLQKYRLELETAMRERQIEINTNKEILFAKRRNMSEEKGRLIRDIKARHMKIEQLQKRLSIAIMALGTDEDGQPLSVTHFKIKNAQEKYMLQQKGDEMDEKVKKAEREIVAMENSLKLVNTSNTTFKKSLSAIEDYDEEVEEMQALEGEISKIMSSIRNKKRLLLKKKHEVEALQELLKSVEEERTEAQANLATAENEYAELKKCHVDQQIKIDRTDRHLHSCMRDLDPRVTEKYHKNLIIRQLQDANKSALQQLAEAATRHQEMTPHITRYLSDYNMTIPGPRTAMVTPSSSSLNSSRSSEYFAQGPYCSPLLLTFQPSADTTKKDKQSKNKTKKSGAKRK